MILFCKSNKFNDILGIIPMNRVYNIRAAGSKIYINYDNGDLIEMDDSTYQPRIETFKVEFKNSFEVQKALRLFYKALNSGKQAFYFG